MDTRVQCVNIFGWKSSTFNVPSGLLGPLLFIFFFNDASKVIQKAKIGIFADDLKLYLKINNMTDALNLQQDINSFSEWCTRNGMMLSIDKCKAMSRIFKENSCGFSKREGIDKHTDRCSTVRLETLKRRRVNSSIFFVFDVLTKVIDAPQHFVFYSKCSHPHIYDADSKSVPNCITQN